MSNSLKDSIERSVEEVRGGEILIFGDLHLSSTFEGSHKEYIEECFSNIYRIVDIAKVQKPSCIIFLGDIVGVRERVLKERRFLKEVIRFFQILNSITNGNVYSVKGNHDIGDFTDFDLLLGLGLLKNPKYIDYIGEDSLEVRFHIVNYGEEKKTLSLASGGSNVVLAHADIQIPGVTTWYYSKNGHILSSMKNWSGVDLVIAGHIHTPSTEISYTTLDGASVGLFYPGSPSRVAERFDDCWYLSFKYSKEEKTTNYDAKLFGLAKASEVFYPKEEKEEVDDDIAIEEERRESLKKILKEVMEERLMTGNIVNQIDLIPNASPKAKSLAKDYLQRAIDGKF